MLFDVLEEFEENLKADVGDIAHRVFERPNYAVEHQLELRRRDVEEGDKTMVVHGLQKQEEICSVLGVFFEVFVDHFERAFEDSVEDFRDLQKNEQIFCFRKCTTFWAYFLIQNIQRNY